VFYIGTLHNWHTIRYHKQKPTHKPDPFLDFKFDNMGIFTKILKLTTGGRHVKRGSERENNNWAPTYPLDTGNVTVQVNTYTF